MSLETAYYYRASDDLSVDMTGWTTGSIEPWDDPEDEQGLVWDAWSDLHYDWRILPYERKVGNRWVVGRVPTLYFHHAMRYYPIEE